ncbi:MAG: hypothetical protein ACO3A2_02730 [Bdellovibrionia bacterium]
MRGVRLGAVLIFAVLPGWSHGAPAHPTTQKKGMTPVQSRRLEVIQRLIKSKDDLGLRVYVKKLYGESLSRGEWRWIESRLHEQASRIGMDLIPLWQSRSPGDLSPLDLGFQNADRLLLAGQFEAAFSKAQQLARSLRKSSDPNSVRLHLPYAYHLMGRALFGARRYDEAVEVYQWIQPGYLHFKQVLFEKMWSAFKAGRVEIALGAIASQHSEYLGGLPHFEAYLIQTYLLKQLCRYEDLHLVSDELQQLEKSLKEGSYWSWAKNDSKLSILYRLVQSPRSSVLELPEVTDREREDERKQILRQLSQLYQSSKATIFKNLNTVKAFENLAQVTDTRSVLKPIRAFENRDELLRQNLEIWPADDAEQWQDEVGKNLFIGESRCQ